MEILATYEDKEDAEGAARRLVGKVRVASERDGGETIYNLFGEPTWKNLYELGMYRLPELKSLLRCRKVWSDAEQIKHREIVIALELVAKKFGIIIPVHWL